MFICLREKTANDVEDFRVHRAEKQQEVLGNTKAVRKTLHSQ